MMNNTQKKNDRQQHKVLSESPTHAPGQQAPHHEKPKETHYPSRPARGSLFLKCAQKYFDHRKYTQLNILDSWFFKC